MPLCRVYTIAFSAAFFLRRGKSQCVNGDRLPIFLLDEETREKPGMPTFRRGKLAVCPARPVASGRHQEGQKKYKGGGRNFWKQIITDDFIVTQNSYKRVYLFCEETHKLVKTNATVRLSSNVR